MFDPLTSSELPSHQPRTTSYWAETCPDHHGPQLENDMDTEVVIIGAGYTGLSCAYHLLSEHQIQPLVLEANSVAWGCSGRNAGFVLNGSGRLSLPEIQARWGSDIAHQVHSEFRGAIDTVSALIEKGKIQCSQTQAGYLKLAHKPSVVKQLQQQEQLLRQQFNDQVQYLSADTIHSEYLNGHQVYGGLYYPYSFGINPLQLAKGYEQMVQEAGGEIYLNSPALSIEQRTDHLVIQTPNARVRAKKLVFATNGYTVNQVHTALDKKHFPVLSSIIVTAPLSQKQLAQCGIKPGLLVMDTRELKYYYRLLPDNRILFGGRGAISGKQANHPIYQQRLLQALHQSYPALKGTKAEYFWSGWISVSIDDYPRIYQYDNQVFYSMGYCGSGVSFATQAGKRLAEQVAGRANTQLPFMQTPLNPFPLARYRRLGLWGFYHWGRFKDKFL